MHHHITNRLKTSERSGDVEIIENDSSARSFRQAEALESAERLHMKFAPGMDVPAVAAAEMGEAQVQEALAHRDTAKKRAV